MTTQTADTAPLKWRRFRITAATCEAEGHEFEVPVGATGDEIAKAAAELATEYLDFGFEEIDE